MKALKKLTLALAAAAFWLLLWLCASMAVGNPLILPSPLSTLSRLAELSLEADFWKTVLASLLRVIVGISVAIPFSALFAWICSSSKIADALFSPAVTLMKSVPVVSFILIAIFLFDRSIIPSAIAFMMVFPVLYGNIREGITSVSRELLEMARVFKLSFFLKIKRIYAPAIAPYFFAAVTASVGLALKAGIAAEVIAYIPLSIGKKLSDAKSYMEPADLLAWTAAILIIGLLLEYVLRITLKRIQRRRTDGKAD